jgi:hypothetical protein
MCKIASAFYPNIAKEKVRRRILTSIVCMSNLMLCQQKYVAHELQAEQEWSKIWKRNNNSLF